MLHILDQSDEESRTILEKSIGHPSKSVLLVKGDGEGVGSFVSRAAQAASEPWRDVLWLKHPELAPDPSVAGFFESGDGEFEAPLLDLDDRVSDRLSVGATVTEIFRAFLEAEAGA